MSERTNAPTCDRCGETMSLTLRHPDDPDDAPDIYICPNVMCGFSHYPPAAVSAPAGETEEPIYDANTPDPEAEAQAEELEAWYEEFKREREAESRSSSPASGAPDEDRLSRLLDLLEDSDVHQRAIALDPADALILRRYVSSQAARLAASERAGEATEVCDQCESEAKRLGNLAFDVARIAHWLVANVITKRGAAAKLARIVRQMLPGIDERFLGDAAALTPTSPAPSPEERADG